MLKTLLVDDPDLAVCLGAVVDPEKPKLLTVSPSGTGDYRTVSEAIKDASPDTKIRVLPGIYREGIILDKPVEIFGEGAVEEIIIESEDSSCVVMETDYAVVRNLTLRCRAENSYGVNIPQGQLILENCHITSNSLACVAIHGFNTTPSIRYCRIHESKQSGIFISEKGEGIIENCDICTA